MTTVEARGRRLKALAHELRNPLASIISSVELMQTLGQHAKEIPHLLTVLEKKAETMATVLNTFFDASEAAQNASIPTPTALGLRVLVVDDNETAADSLSQLLALHGYDVQIAYGGAEGLQKAIAFMPQVAILDIDMPDIDGYQLAQMLRKESFSCICIALTGFGQATDKQKAFNGGFDFHITKPSRLKDIEVILQGIAVSIEKKRSAVSV
jgi:CheY-like chemotaxis protein